MPVSVQTPTITHTGNGVSTVFAFDFLILGDADLKAKIDDVATTAFSVTGAGSPTGGEATFTTAPANGAKVLLYRDTALERDTNYQVNGDLPSSTLNEDIDRTILMLQEVVAGIKVSPNTVRGPVGEDLDALPPASQRLGLQLLFHPTTGQPYLAAPVSGTAADVLVQIASSASTLVGGALVGYDQFLDYTGLTMAAAVRTLGINANAITGMDPTGAADSSPAISTLFSQASSGMKIRFFGTYKLTGQAACVSKALTIDASGATFNLSGNNAGFAVSGDVPRFEVYGGTIVGDGVTRASSLVAQIGWMFGNAAGANVRNVLVQGVSVESTNIGFKFAPGTGGGSGNPSGCRIIACKAKNIRGTVAGVGYGFQLTYATDSKIALCETDDCDRHSIYLSQGEGYELVGNLVKNHRLTAHDGSFRAAIVVSRVSRVTILGGEVLDAYDGQLEVSHDTVTSSNCSQVDVIGLRLNNRKNSVWGVAIGEQGVPSGYLVSDVRLDLRIQDDHASVSGEYAVMILNGARISLAGTKIRRTGITGTSKLVSVGNGSYISASADCTDTTLVGMELTCEGSVLTDTRVIDIDSDICTNTSSHRIGPNVYRGAAYEAYPNAGITNGNLVIQDSSGTIQAPYTAGDTSPSVANRANYIEVSNAGAVSLTALDDGVKGQRVLLRNVGAGNCTLLAANFYTPGAVNLVLGQNDNATLVCRATGGAWEVVSTSNN